MATSAAPTKIGRYEVERMLGQGGMGRVWLARDTVLGRRVAVKVLRDDLSLPPRVKDELFVRMEHEARAAAAVSHPNIVTLHDMGEDKAVGVYLVFEYVSRPGEGDEKHSLRERLTSGPLPFPEIAKLAREVGSALTYAHEAGVIHRDVKPENILFSRTGFKIADFGIARIPESTITRANTVLGTPAYTAPEALGNGDFSPASDQFALAATLYEAATGRRAFQAEDAIATAGKVSSEPPPPLPSIIGSEPLVLALDQALQRGLAKAPGDRFASCAELGEEVARAIESSGAAQEPTRRTRSIPSPLLLSPPPVMTLERTPLSSRSSSLRVQVDPPVPSPLGSETTLYQRKRTQRFQNVAVALAVLVIVALVLIGRRTPREASGETDGGSAPAPEPAPKPRAKPKASAHVAPIVVDAGDPPDAE